MVAAPAAETPAIDRTACPSRGGHGTEWHRRRHGCRCTDSLEDQRRRLAGLPPGQQAPELYVPVVGTSRRLQAAAVRGWSAEHIAERCGMTQQHVSRLRAPNVTKVSAAIAARVTRVVDELHRLPEPVDSPGKGAAHRRTRAHAERVGWLAIDEWADVDDPADLPDSAYRRDPDSGATDDGTALAELREMADVGLCLAELVERTGLSDDDVQARLDNMADTDRRRSRRTLSADQVYAIRVDYLRHRDTWTDRDAAARYGVSHTLIGQIIRGATRPELGLTDLTEGDDRKAKGRIQTNRIPVEVIHAVRADYVDHRLGYIRLAARHDLTRDTARRIVRGRIRPELGLTDLTTAAGSAAAQPPTAASPAGNEPRKETPAA